MVVEFQPLMEDNCLHYFDSFWKVQKYRAPLLDTVAETSCFEEFKAGWLADPEYHDWVCHQREYVVSQEVGPLEDVQRLVTHQY